MPNWIVDSWSVIEVPIVGMAADRMVDRIHDVRHESDMFFVALVLRGLDRMHFASLLMQLRLLFRSSTWGVRIAHPLTFLIAT